MPRSTQVLLVTAVAVFASFLDATIVNIAFPSIRASFAPASIGDVSWVLSGYSIVFAAGLIPAGLAGDLVGRRRLFLGGLAVFAVASGLCALAPSVGVLVACRVLQAAGAAALVPSSLGLLLPEFPPERRANATALWGATGAVAAATGPTLGGLLVQVDWRWVFVVNVPICAVALVAGRRVLVERRDPSRAVRPDVPGVLALVAGIALLTLGVTEGPPTAWGWGDPRTVGALVLAVVSLGVVVRRSARRPEALVDVTLLGRRPLAAATAGLFAFSLAFYALLLANVTFLTTVWHYDILKAGLAISPSPVCAALSSVVAGRLYERLGPRAVATPGVLVFAAGCALFAARTGTRPDYLADWLPASIIAGLGIGTTFAAFGAAAVSGLPPNRFATGGAIAQTSRQIGAAVGVAAFVAVFGSPVASALLDAFHRCWWVMSAAAVVAGACGLALGQPAARAAAAPARAVDVEPQAST